MALKDKVKIPNIKAPQLAKVQSSALLRWYLGLAGAVFLCLVLAGLIWMSGRWETRAAFNDGRRLLIRLDNGDIEGKVASTGPAAPPAPAAENPPATSNKAGASGSGNPSVTTSTAVTEGTTALPSPLGKLDNGPIAAAAVPLAPLNNGLLEKTSAGMLPAIGSDGTKPWLYYAKPYDRRGSLPMVAVIITGLGESRSVSEGAARLPENFDLSFSPYARDVDTWVKTARTAGHEVFLDLPLEPSNYPASDPGPYGLLLKQSPEENLARLQWLMARAQGYVGFVTPQNEAFSSNTKYFKALLQSLSDRGLMLAAGHEPAKNETKQLLDGGNAAAITADTLIDEDLSPTAIQTRLMTLEQIAKTRGYAIGIAGAFPITIEQLRAWAAKLQEQGFVLVPVTFIVHLRFS